jgi:hypothetical protein
MWHITGTQIKGTEALQQVQKLSTYFWSGSNTLVVKRLKSGAAITASNLEWMTRV